jgi:hypothetical protein
MNPTAHADRSSLAFGPSADTRRADADMVGDTLAAHSRPSRGRRSPFIEPSVDPEDFTDPSIVSLAGKYIESTAPAVFSLDGSATATEARKSYTLAISKGDGDLALRDDSDTTTDAVEFPDMPIALRTLLDRYGDLTALQARGIVHGLSEEQKTHVRGYFLNKPEVHAEFLPDANDADKYTMYNEETFFNDLAIFCMFRDDSDVKEFLQTRMPSLSLQRLYDLIELLIVAGFTKSLDVALKILPPNCELVDDTLFTKIEVWKYPHKARDVKSGSADRVFGSNPYGTLLTLVENDSWTGWLEFCCRIVKEYYLPTFQDCEIDNKNVQNIIQTLLKDFRAIETLKLLDVLTTPDFWYEYVADKEKLKIEMQIQVHTALGKINLQEGRWPQIISNFAGKRAELKALQTIQSMVLNAEVAVRTLEQQLEMHEDVIKTYLHRFMPTA